MSKVTAKVRCALPSDAKYVSELYCQLVSNPNISVLPERIAQISNDPNTALFVCEINDLICGTALVSLCADVMFKKQPFAVIENFVVDNSLRGQGIGLTLFRHIEAFCLSTECSKIMLLSSVDRNQAHRFFERVGLSSSFKRGFVKYRRDFDLLVAS